MEQPNITSEHLAGALRFQRVLAAMTTEDEDVPSQFPKSGLHHDLSIPSRDVRPDDTQRKKRK